MAELGRASSLLPTIKCSMCAADIEISQMGDHVCGGGEGKIFQETLKVITDKTMAATPPPESYGNLNTMPFKKVPSNGSGFLKPGRAMPPRVDTSAASM